MTITRPFLMTMNEAEETIRCTVIKCGPDYLDLVFPKNSEGLVRYVRLLMKNPDGDALAQLPEHIAFGYAMSTHKAQGSQFKYVIVLAERGYAKHGVVQGSNIYTATSRAQERAFIIGKLEDFCQAATTTEIQRVTLLEKLLKEGSR
jgi:ATP-dependent exoDNAse (exonuclease V) alpha subunit